MFSGSKSPCRKPKRRMRKQKIFDCTRTMPQSDAINNVRPGTPRNLVSIYFEHIGNTSKTTFGSRRRSIIRSISLETQSVPTGPLMAPFGHIWRDAKRQMSPAWPVIFYLKKFLYNSFQAREKYLEKIVFFNRQRAKEVIIAVWNSCETMADVKRKGFPSPRGLDSNKKEGRGSRDQLALVLCPKSGAHFWELTKL